MNMMGLVIVIAVIIVITLTLGFIATHGTYNKTQHH